MWQLFKRKFAWQINSQAEYLVNNFPSNRHSKMYEDEKIIISYDQSDCTAIYIKPPEGNQICVFKKENVWHKETEKFRYGRWVNYLFSLKSQADAAVLKNSKEKDQQKKFNLSDIDDSSIFGD